MKNGYGGCLKDEPRNAKNYKAGGITSCHSAPPRTTRNEYFDIKCVNGGDDFPKRGFVSQELTQTASLEKMKKLVKDQETHEPSNSEMCIEITSRMIKSWERLCEITGSQIQIHPHSCCPGKLIQLITRKDLPLEWVDSNPWHRESSVEKDEVFKEASSIVFLMSEHINFILKANGTQPEERTSQEFWKELQNVRQKADYIIQCRRTWNRDLVKIFSNLEQELSKIVFADLNLAILSCLSESQKRSFKATESDLLCGIVGLDSRFSNRLLTLGTEELGHEAPIYFFKKWIQMNWDKNVEHNMTDGNSGENLKKIFESLGFTSERSIKIVDAMEDDLLTSQPGLFWALNYIEIMFASHPLLSTCSGEPPYESQKRNEWFMQTIQRIHTDQQIQEYDIEMINSYNDEMKVLQKLTALEKTAKERQQELWYHGTPLFEYADSILKEGIILKKGTRKKDFSIKNGFYLSDDFKSAHSWGKTNSGGNNFAVLVFRIKPDGLTKNFLDLKNNMNLWRKVVRCNRSGYSKEVDLKNGIKMSENPGQPADDQNVASNPDIKVMKLKEFDMIKGPICGDVDKVLDDSSTELPHIRRDQNGRDVQQMCVIGKICAKKIDSLSNIQAVFWFV